MSNYLKNSFEIAFTNFYKWKQDLRINILSKNLIFLILAFSFLGFYFAFFAVTKAQICPTSQFNLPVQNNCHAYYSCSTGTPTLSYCSNGQVYDCFNQKCSNQTHPACCPYDANVKWTTMFSNNVILENYPCTIGYSLQNTLGVCGSYFGCHLGTVQSLKCSNNEVFDDSSLTCSTTQKCKYISVCPIINNKYGS